MPIKAPERNEMICKQGARPKEANMTERKYGKRTENTNKCVRSKKEIQEHIILHRDDVSFLISKLKRFL